MITSCVLTCLVNQVWNDVLISLLYYLNKLKDNKDKIKILFSRFWNCIVNDGITFSDPDSTCLFFMKRKQAQLTQLIAELRFDYWSYDPDSSALPPLNILSHNF